MTRKPKHPPDGLRGALCSLEDVLYFVQGDAGFERRTRKLARDVMKAIKKQQEEQAQEARPEQ